MDATQLKLLGMGVFFLFIFLSGLRLSRSGKPYNPILFNLHKLSGLAAGIFLGVNIYRIHQASPLSQTELIAVVITILFFVGTIIAGGLVSIDKPMPKPVPWLHKIMPYLTVISTAATLYLLASSA